MIKASRLAAQTPTAVPSCVWLCCMAKRPSPGVETRSFQRGGRLDGLPALEFRCPSPLDGCLGATNWSRSSPPPSGHADHLPHRAPCPKFSPRSTSAQPGLWTLHGIRTLAKRPPAPVPGVDPTPGPMPGSNGKAKARPEGKGGLRRQGSSGKKQGTPTKEREAGESSLSRAGALRKVGARGEAGGGGARRAAFGGAQLLSARVCCGLRVRWGPGAQS